ncbi:MAG: efflux RND transporter periplasmic adaptor subunit [Betaproteobacteria bacterium]|nr:efflux RND transporter periplasmic adaptor subunit [Betaproteobacteria bacterium]
MKRLLLLVLAVGAITAAGLYWKYSATPARVPVAASGAGKPPHGLPVKTQAVGTGTITEEVSAVGTLIASESVMIRPERDGRIEAIYFSEGQLVRKGEKLVSLDASEIEAQLAAANAELSLNRSRMKRAEELKEKNFISAQALDEARENVNQSLARQAEIKARLEKTVIVAPFEGVAGLRQVSPGAYVKAGQDIARLEGIGTLKLDFRVPEVYLGRLKPRQAVQVRLDGFADEQIEGAVYAIEPAVDEQSRTVLMRARIPNPGVRLKPGMFARVTLALGKRENVLLAPEQAIVPRGGDTYVFRVVEGKAALTKVELGLRRPGEVEVVAGVSAGDMIVVDGQLKLQDGTAVAVLAQKPKPLAAEAKQKQKTN